MAYFQGRTLSFRECSSVVTCVCPLVSKLLKCYSTQLDSCDDDLDTLAGHLEPFHKKLMIDFLCRKTEDFVFACFGSTDFCQPIFFG